MAVSVVRDPSFRQHLPSPSHPESPGRLRAIDRALDASALTLVEREARPATREELLRAHDAALVDAVERSRGVPTIFDADTRTSAVSVDAALRAAGAAIDLATHVARGEAPPGIALVRPPGHHATRDRVMGFCLFNNVAIAARALQAAGLAERVAIFDFDVHHGNGTEAIFLDDPTVFFASTHQHPAYPGTGAPDVVGVGAAEGTNLNVPLAPGDGDAALHAALDAVVLPAIARFAPDVILLSAGFDAFDGDPLGALRVTPEGFRGVAERFRRFAEAHTEGRVAAVLEGGYHLDGLGRSVRAFLEAWDT